MGLWSSIIIDSPPPSFYLFVSKLGFPTTDTLHSSILLASTTILLMAKVKIAVKNASTLPPHLRYRIGGRTCLSKINC
jgi:hypothetical protein